jgi:hypothetical protein
MKKGIRGEIVDHLIGTNTARVEEERKRDQEVIQEVNHLQRNLHPPRIIAKEMIVILVITIIERSHPVNIEVEVAVILVKEEKTEKGEEAILLEVEVHQEEENVPLLIIQMIILRSKRLFHSTSRFLSSMMWSVSPSLLMGTKQKDCHGYKRKLGARAFELIQRSCSALPEIIPLSRKQDDIDVN